MTAIGTLIRRAYSGAPWIAGATPGSKQLNILPRAGSALRASAHAIWFRGSHHCSEPRSYCGTPAQREDSPNPQQSAPPIRFLVVRHAYKLELMAYPNRRSIASSRIPPHPHPLARIFLRRASLIEQGPWHRFHIRPQEHLYHRRRAGTNKTTCDAPSLKLTIFGFAVAICFSLMCQTLLRLHRSRGIAVGFAKHNIAVVTPNNGNRLVARVNPEWESRGRIVAPFRPDRHFVPPSAARSDAVAGST